MPRRISSIMLSVHEEPALRQGRYPTWVGVVSMRIEPGGGWFVMGDCGCRVSQDCWERCGSHSDAELLYFQQGLSSEIAGE